MAIRTDDITLFNLGLNDFKTGRMRTELPNRKNLVYPDGQTQASSMDNLPCNQRRFFQT